MQKPPQLTRGDRVRIVLPASPVRPEMFEQGLAQLRAIGLDPVHGDIDRKWRYLAGEDSTRRAELVDALSDASCKAIFFARGGYGTSRLLTDLRSLSRRLDPKILLGCSDITTLHLYFQRIHDWVVFHGPMTSGDFARRQVHLPSLQQALFQTQPYSLVPDSVQILRDGEAEGILVGGCLTLLEAATGTAWEPDWKDAILFMEDIAAKPYQLDRMLTHLKILKKFDSVRAFIFGEMKDCIQVENQGYSIQEVILDVLSEFGKPIFFHFPSGHVTGLNWTLPLGIRARVSSSPSFRLDILEAAVR